MELIKIIAIFLGATFLLIGILSIPMNFLAEQICFSTYSEYQPTYGFLSRCRIEWQGKLTPVEMIKNININETK